MSVSINYQISYRNIKYPRIEFTTGELWLILPNGYEHDNLLEKYKNWIIKKNNFILECLQDSEGRELIVRNEHAFKVIIKSLSDEVFEELGGKKELGDTIVNTYFKKMKTKWASMSSKRNLTINTQMKHLPEQLIKYIIFHEITHLMEKRHNERFWKIIALKYPDYKSYERELFIYWFVINRERSIIKPH